MEQINITKEEFLDRLAPLNSRQFDNVKVKVKESLLKNLGPQPDRKSVTRDMGPLLRPDDWLALIIFVAAFAVSAIHIMSLVGGVTSNLNVSVNSNTLQISSLAFNVTHQLSFILLAEFSMILFMVRWRLSTRRRHEIYTVEGVLVMSVGQRVVDYLSIDLVLAILAVGFTLYANLESKLPLIESILPPLFTIGIGFHLEHVFVEMLHRNEVFGKMLSDKITSWELAVNNVMNSAEYKKLLIRSLWDGIISIPSNAWAMDYPPEFKWAAVNREFDKESWIENNAISVSKPTPKAIGAGTSSLAPSVLLDAVMNADENSEKITVGSHWIDMKEYKWYDADSNKIREYSSKGRMISGIKQVQARA